MIDTWTDAGILAGIGIVLHPRSPALLVRGTAAASAALACGLLLPTRRELERRVERLQETRAGAVDAARLELERIERDLHDGAQARLVAVAMELGRAEQKLAGRGHRRPPRRSSRRRARTPSAPSPSCATWPAGSARRSSPSAACARRSRRSRRARACRRPSRATSAARVPDGRRDRGVLRRRRGARERRQARRRLGGRRARRAPRHDRLEVEVRDDGRGGAERPTAAGSPACASASRRSTARSSSRARPAGPTILRAELPCAS